MAKVELEFHDAGFQEILKGASTVAKCMEEAHTAIAGSESKGYEIDHVVGLKRATIRIVAATDEAIKDNLKNNTLLKAVTR